MHENKEAKGRGWQRGFKRTEGRSNRRSVRRRKARKTEVEKGRSSSRRVHEKIKAGECNVKGVNSETRKKCHARAFRRGRTGE